MENYKLTKENVEEVTKKLDLFNALSKQIAKGEQLYQDLKDSTYFRMADEGLILSSIYFRLTPDESKELKELVRMFLLSKISERKKVLDDIEIVVPATKVEENEIEKCPHHLTFGEDYDEADICDDCVISRQCFNESLKRKKCNI